MPIRIFSFIFTICAIKFQRKIQTFCLSKQLFFNYMYFNRLRMQIFKSCYIKIAKKVLFGTIFMRRQNVNSESKLRESDYDIKQEFSKMTKSSYRGLNLYIESTDLYFRSADLYFRSADLYFRSTDLYFRSTDLYL
jgi:hypothetical protein